MEIKETTKDLLVHINTLSAAALNKIENSKIDSENVYIKRQLIKAKLELREAYLRLMDMR